MNEGWKCPNCGKSHAPWLATCDQENVTWTTGFNCIHEYVNDTGGDRCRKCGKSGNTPDYTIICSVEPSTTRTIGATGVGLI